LTRYIPGTNIYGSCSNGDIDIVSYGPLMSVGTRSWYLFYLEIIIPPWILLLPVV